MKNTNDMQNFYHTLEQMYRDIATLFDNEYVLNNANCDAILNEIDEIQDKIAYIHKLSMTRSQEC